MEAQGVGKGAGDAPPPQISFGKRARDRLGLLPERSRWACALLDLGFPFRLALREGFRIGRGVVSRRNARCRQDFREIAATTNGISRAVPARPLHGANLFAFMV